MSSSAMKVCMVLSPIANYPCIIAFCRDNSNVGMCADPFSPREGSGSKTRSRVVLLSMNLDHLYRDNTVGLWRSSAYHHVKLRTQTPSSC